MNFTELTVRDHRIVRVDFLGDSATLQKVSQQAAAKAPYTGSYDPAARARTTQEVYNAQYLGTLADMACSTLLQQYLDRNSPDTFKVERYDDVRTDSFRNPDQYDTRILHDSQSLAEVEIRSSVCSRVPLARMLEVFDVLGWYVTAHKGAEKRREFYMRPVYHFNQYATADVYKQVEADRHLAAGSLDLYIVGGATADMLAGQGTVSRQSSLDQVGASYQVMKILSALDVPEFLDSVLQCCKGQLGPGSIQST